ncbi:hypothetical protein BV898_16211 [Hypsibius exemplaris]|uniref:Receptor ligand binding region domain-containing protein n=1 Tax=Hypsibius exemplaris TaxID=2072580 RepID=A0A9X6RL93_HYPEX|nr:hypothetical protein BV898_16211 [Hypsibius exemplaris]
MVTSENPRFGLVPTGPAYDVAIERVKRLYPEALQVWNTIRRFQVSLPGIFPCDAASVEMHAVAGRMSSMLEQLEGFTILLAPEWNIPLLASSASDGRLTNKKRYPTVTAFGPVDLQSFANAVELFLDQYSWRTVTLMCDKLNRWPLLSAVYSILCQNVQMKLESNHRYSVNFIPFDSRNDTRYDVMLDSVRSFSRSKADTNSHGVPNAVPLMDFRAVYRLTFP